MPAKTYAILLAVVIAAAAITVGAVSVVGGTGAVALLLPATLVAAWLARGRGI